MAHESKSKHKEIYLEEQKNAGVNSMEIAALNKSEPVGKGLEVLHGTKEWQPDKKGNHRAKQNKSGDGDWRRPGTSARNRWKSIEYMRNRSSKQNKAGGEGLELVRGTNGSQSEDKGHR